MPMTAMGRKQSSQSKMRRPRTLRGFKVLNKSQKRDGEGKTIKGGLLGPPRRFYDAFTGSSSPDDHPGRAGWRPEEGVYTAPLDRDFTNHDNKL